MPRAGDVIQQSGDTVGQITSACYAPALGRPIALGYLKRGVYDAGTAVEIWHDGVPLPARVAATPLASSG